MNKKQENISSLYCLNKQVSSCWDDNVCIRSEDLEQGTDNSYINVLRPWVLEKVIQYSTNESWILDVGCGCGFLSNAIYESGRSHILGIDISTASIEYARKRYPNISFDCKDICEYISTNQYDLCLAVMTLNNLPNLEGFFSAIHELLADSGRVVMVIPHPFYWPQRHLINQDYSYSQEKPYKYCFSTKGRSDYVSPVLYFHRTLETYYRCIQASGFQIAMLQELWDTSDRATPDILGIELTLA